MNLLYCLNLAVIQTDMILNNIDSQTIKCQVAGFLLVMSGIGSVLTQPLLALNHYSAMFYRQRHSEIFSRRNILSMTVAIYVLSFLMALAYQLLGDYDKFSNLSCIDIVSMDIVHLLVFFMIPVAAAYAVSLFCDLRITRLLRDHENQNSRNYIHSAIKKQNKLLN